MDCREGAGPQDGQSNGGGDRYRIDHAYGCAEHRCMRHARQGFWHVYLTREAARQDVFDYIEMFYNPKRKHTNNGMLSPVDFETRQQKLNKAGV
jgi:transposase InsO family protein